MSKHIILPNLTQLLTQGKGAEYTLVNHNYSFARHSIQHTIDLLLHHPQYKYISISIEDTSLDAQHIAHKAIKLNHAKHSFATTSINDHLGILIAPLSDEHREYLSHIQPQSCHAPLLTDLEAAVGHEHQILIGDLDQYLDSMLHTIYQAS